MHILIAEDDTHLREGIELLLSDEGYNCTAAEDGEAALAAFKANRPDFCILDVMMPKLDGFELCRRIRQLDELVPIILLTAKGEEIDRVVGLELGADDYIPKPFGTRELIARIKAISRRASHSANSKSSIPQTPFTMAHLHIDPKSMRASLDGTTIELTTRELNVLVMLYENKGKVVKRIELFEECWGRRYMANSRALDQFISQLRQKIERDPSNPQIIRTVHGAGYRFEDEPADD